ncbi:hypothetical protein ABIB40_002703 [Pedobacter sp. UYP30]
MSVLRLLIPTIREASEDTILLIFLKLMTLSPPKKKRGRLVYGNFALSDFSGKQSLL